MKALLMLGALAFAQELPHPLTPGTYAFQTQARNAKGPVCSEQWELRADGTMTVRSGEEVVEATYRLTHDRDGDWISSTSVATNHKPDCTGTVTQSLSNKENRTLVIALNGGDILTCPPPGHTADGTPVTTSCFGSLVRVK